jgi:MoaA/NifB/PqqE/SkfB family radical SAM enzyme
VNPAITSLPIVILYPHSRCNCRCVMCDIWKGPERQELSLHDLERYAGEFESLSVQWVVLSGGEPLMHSDLFRFCALLRERDIRTTILSTGLLLERHAARIAACVDDVIVSLDGPPEVHDSIRRVPGAYAALARGTGAVLKLQPQFPISARSTVQRRNHRHLRETARTARDLGLRSISFLAADLTSAAFNRPQGWTAERQSEVALSESETADLEREIEALIPDSDLQGFVLENPEKLRRIVRHFKAHLGLCDPVAPRCNAPWVSAVIEADRTVRPCFFHETIGKLNGSLLNVLNSPQALSFRSALDTATNPVCQRCVCSLNWVAACSAERLNAEDVGV